MEAEINFHEIAEGEQLVCEDVQPANLRRLASAMITEAARAYFEPGKRSWSYQVEAALWLRSQEASYFFEFLGMTEVDVIKLLTCKHKPKLRLKGPAYA